MLVAEIKICDELFIFPGRTPNFEKGSVPLVILSVRLFVLPHGTTRLKLGRFIEMKFGISLFSANLSTHFKFD